VHKFHTDDTTVDITIKLMDDDAVSGDDLADVSAYKGGGKDDDISDKRAAIYHGTYNLATNTISGDTTTEEDGYYVILGDGINNAKVWFKIIDNYEPEPDLECKGSLRWTGVTPGSTVTNSFTTENIGDSYSQLDWEVIKWPNWGTWEFDPKSGEDLTPNEGKITVKVTVITPDQLNKEFTGEVKIVNKENSSDYEIIPVSLITPRIIPTNINLYLLNRLFQRFQNIIQILRYLSI
jgi:hypothetical protein